MDPKLILDAGALTVTVVVSVAGLVAWFARSAAESAIHAKAAGLMDKIEDVGTRLIGRIDALKDEVAGIATGLRVSEERHANLVRETERLGYRLDRLEGDEPPRTSQAGRP